MGYKTVSDFLGAVLDSKSFDTHGNTSAGVDLSDYLNAINGE